jgi:hypothetical protein
MPSIRDVFPDKWLKASHLILADGRRPILAVTVRGAGVEKLHNPNTGQKEPRLVIEFDGKDKRLILNKTQAEAIASITGTEDYTQWRGARLAIQAGIAPNKKDTILILAPSTPMQTKTPWRRRASSSADSAGSMSTTFVSADSASSAARADPLAPPPHITV